MANTSRSRRSALETIQKNGNRNIAAAIAMPRCRATRTARAELPRRDTSDVIVDPASLQPKLQRGQCHDHGEQHPGDRRSIAETIGHEALAIDGIAESGGGRAWTTARKRIDL